jgi:hypothetical protein
MHLLVSQRKKTHGAATVWGTRPSSERLAHAKLTDGEKESKGTTRGGGQIIVMHLQRQRRRCTVTRVRFMLRWQRTASHSASVMILPSLCLPRGPEGHARRRSSCSASSTSDKPPTVLAPEHSPSSTWQPGRRPHGPCTARDRSVDLGPGRGARGVTRRAVQAA